MQRVTGVNKTGSGLQRNIEARSCNHCCCGKTVGITYSECVCAPYCHLWPVGLYIFSPHYPINGTIFEKKKIEHKVCLNLQGCITES